MPAIIHCPLCDRKVRVPRPKMFLEQAVPLRLPPLADFS